MIEHMDNFSAYGDNSTADLMLNGVWAQLYNGTGQRPYLSPDPAGTAGSTVLALGPSYGGALSTELARYAFQNTCTTGGVALRLWLDALPFDEDMQVAPVQIRNGGNFNIVCFTISTTGRIRIRSGDHYGTILAESALPAVTANGWYHIEFKYIFTPTVRYEVRVEGNTVASYTAAGGTDIAAQFAIVNRPNPTSNSITYFVKDLVLWNNLGTDNIDWMGSVVVYNIQPTSDFALNWTPVGGDTTGWQILDNSPPNDSKYISAAYPAPSPYVANMSDLPADVTSVRGIMTMVRAAKTDGGDGSFQASLISGASTGNGANRPITVAQTYWRDVFERDPATNAAWLPAAVNAVKMKLNRTL